MLTSITNGCVDMAIVFFLFSIDYVNTITHGNNLIHIVCNLW